jgi:hypothetical protein
MTLVELARKFRGVREAGPNTGLRVEAIQHWSGGQPGDSWCMEWVWMVVDLFHDCQPPFERVQNVEQFHQLAINNGWVAPLPIVGDLVISIDPTNGKGHHIGICTETNPFTTIAGNTSEDGKSREGTGVFEHEMTMRNKVFVRLP